MNPNAWWADDDQIKGLDAAYRLAMGVPLWVDGATGQVEIKFYQSYRAWEGWGPLMVRIRVDGYEVRFPHTGDLRVPPTDQWVKIPIPTEREEP